MPRPREKEIRFAFQGNLTGLSLESAAINPGCFEFLDRLRPRVAGFQPLVMIGFSGQVIKNSLRKPAVDNLWSFPNIDGFSGAVSQEGLKPKGIVVKIISVTDSGGLKYLASIIEKPPKAWERRIWLVDDKEVNPQILKQLRLFDLETGATKSGLYWATGRPEIKTKRKPVDLTRFPWIKPVQERVADELSTRGWLVVDQSEINSLLAESRFPPRDIRRLTSGFGLYVQGPCGQCLWRINLNGTVAQIRKCLDNSVCQKILDKLKPKAPPKCSCGQFCVWHPKPGKYICPSCGDDERN